jgi:hypothetical protein
MIDCMIPEMKARVEVFIIIISARACEWRAAADVSRGGKGGCAS